MGGQLFTTAEAAAYLSMNAYTLEFWRTRKQRCGPVYLRIHSHCIRYRLADLDAFLESRVVKPARGTPSEKK